MQRAASAPNFSRVHGGDAGDQAVGRRVLDQVVDLAPPALGGDRRASRIRQSEPSSTRWAMFSRAVRWLVLRRRSTEAGTVFVERDGVALDQFGEIGTDVVEIDIGSPRSTSWASISTGSRKRIASSCISVAPASAATLVTLPPCGASRDAPSSWIRAPRSAGRGGRDRPSATSMADDRALQRRRHRRPSRPARLPMPRPQGQRLVIGGVADSISAFSTSATRAVLRGRRRDRRRGPR